MIRKCFPIFIAFALVLVIGFGSSLRADDVDQRTLFTINQPISLPGHIVLPAGSYMIRRLNATSPVVQIFDHSETHLYATLMSIPDFVMDPADKPEFTFQETPEGRPPVLRTWHSAGQQFGYEFLPAE